MILHLGDCIQFMKGLEPKSIDMIFTDPPYGLSYNQNDLSGLAHKVFGQRRQTSHNGIQNDDEETAMKLFESFLIESKRVLKKGACCCCCCGGGGPKPLFARWTLMMDDIIGFKQAVVWNKPGLGMGIHFRRNYEFVLVAQNGDPAHRWNGGNNTPNVVTINKIIPSSEQHPTEKPYELAGHFIKLFSNEGDKILDPFMGHGSTGIAALKLKRAFIGCELDVNHYNKAKEKLSAEKAQLSFV